MYSNSLLLCGTPRKYRQQKLIAFLAREDMLRARNLASMSHTRRQATADRDNGPPPSQRATDSFYTVRSSSSVFILAHGF